MIPPRLNIVTLGVASVAASRAFYERLGWQASGASQDGIVFFQLGPMVLALFDRADLADDAGVRDAPSGFCGMTLAQNFASIGEVDAAYAAAIAAGARSLKSPQTAFWGGHTAYIADPDGFAWEFAFNPHFALDPSGHLVLPA